MNNIIYIEKPVDSFDAVYIFVVGEQIKNVCNMIGQTSNLKYEMETLVDGTYVAFYDYEVKQFLEDVDRTLIEYEKVYINQRYWRDEYNRIVNRIVIQKYLALDI